MSALLAAALFLGCAPNPTEELEKAADILARGDYERALREYQAVYHRHDEREIKVRALYWIADINKLYLNNYQEAVKNFETIVLEYPDHPLALTSCWNIALAFHENFKEYRQAIFKYQDLVNRFPEAPEAAEAQLAMAKCYARLGENQQAIVEARQLIKSYPESPLLPKAYLFIADLQFMDGRYKDAKETYTKMAERFSRHDAMVEVSMGLALTDEKLGDKQAALDHYLKIKDTYPNKELVARRIKRLQELIAKDEKKPRMKW